MLSLSLKKLVTCGVIRSFNFCILISALVMMPPWRIAAEEPVPEVDGSEAAESSSCTHACSKAAVYCFFFGVSSV